VNQNTRALCHGCGEQHHVTVAGVFRRHRHGQVTCSGAGEYPQGSVAAAAPRPKPTGPPPPNEPADGRSCDAGHCSRPSVGWRLFRGQREWLPVCGICMDGPAGRTRTYDQGEPS
jgi:hypothetical protein